MVTDQLQLVQSWFNRFLKKQFTCLAQKTYCRKQLGKEGLLYIIIFVAVPIKWYAHSVRCEVRQPSSDLRKFSVPINPMQLGVSR